MYARLVAYKAQHGDCTVPRVNQDRALARWLTTQRTLKVKGHLYFEQIQWLNTLGFAWDPLTARWEAMYARLVAYKAQHGDCTVPQIFKQDRPLGRWVTTQRTLKVHGQLYSERIQRLEALGFVWNLLRGRGEKK